jgi:hypothetical protein
MNPETFLKVKTSMKLNGYFLFREELYQRIVRERFRARSSKNNDSQVKGKPGERVRPTEERDENEDRNKPVKKTVSQQPQQQEVFTTAFQ